MPRGQNAESHREHGRSTPSSGPIPPAENPFPGRIAAVLFDLDGTLMDTDDQMTERVGRWLSRLHLPHAERLARRMVMLFESPVNGLVTLLDRIGLDKPLLDLLQRLRHGQKMHRHDFHIIPGVAELLASLRGRYRLGVVTTRSETEAEAFIAQHQLQDIFEFVIGRTSTRRLKPHPEPVRLASLQLDIPVERCLMVGDTTMDIRSAVAAGAPAAGVLCGYGTRKELEQAGATVVVEHITDLAALLNAPVFQRGQPT
ncbi:MAG TPA: HAD family hydrolase [bacterium]|nr:HAD family hydrolase [bacterium]HPM58206.1 HAD family hydrolase [bacterium]